MVDKPMKTAFKIMLYIALTALFFAVGNSCQFLENFGRLSISGKLETGYYTTANVASAEKTISSLVVE